MAGSRQPAFCSAAPLPPGTMEKEISSQKLASTEKRVLAYADLGFAVHDKKTKQLKSILQDVSGRVERARVARVLPALFFF